jgi:hypothetical protein
MLRVEAEPMSHRPACVLLLTWLAVGCVGVRARSDFDPNARFDSYRSFAWLSEEPGTLSGGPGTEGVDPLLARRIRESIERHLESRGYRKLDDPATADFVVSFSMGSRERIEIQSSPALGGGYYGYGGWYAGTSLSATAYTEGTLSIDVFDGTSHQAVWHGWASKRLDESANRAALVDEVVRAILAKFPPPR